jgi:tRNA(adenine34) deaminase
MTPKQKDEYYMQIALSEAEKAFKLDEVPIGAVCVLDDKIISCNHNKVIMLNDATAHAEILALQDAMKKTNNYRLPNLEIYISKEPCCMCAGAIIHTRVGRVIIGAMDKKSGAAISNFQIFDNEILNHQPKITTGVLAEQSKNLLQSFFQQKRKRPANRC